MAEVSSNMSMVAFKAAANAARLNLTRRYTRFPDDNELLDPAAVQILDIIVAFLQHIPHWHRRTWNKMLVRAYPELVNNTLEQILHKLVVRSWKLRQTAKPFALHDFVEFCAGEGNLTAQCLKAGLFGVALDLRYHSDHNMTTRVGLRVMTDCISEAVPGALIWWGTRCSSFVAISRRHHMRSSENGFWGNERHAFVREGNLMQVPVFSYGSNFCTNIKHN